MHIMAKQKKKKRSKRNEQKLSKKDRSLFFLIYGTHWIPIFALFLYSMRTQIQFLKHIYGANIIYGELSIGGIIIIALDLLILIISSLCFYDTALSFQIPFEEYLRGGKGIFSKTRRHFKKSVIFTSIMYILTGVSLLISCFQCTTIDEAKITKHNLIKQDKVLLTYDDINEIQIVSDHSGYRSSASFDLIVKSDKNETRLGYEYFNDGFDTVEKFLSNFNDDIIHIDEYSASNAIQGFPKSKSIVDRYK